MNASVFFNGVEQQPISIRGQPGKAPMFFRRVRMMGAMFLADLATARRQTPGEAWKPLQVLPSRTVAAIHCLEYLDTDIGPYNEVSVAIGLHGAGFQLPGPLAAMRSALTRQFHAHILQLPVTTDVALWGGIDFLNYPKFLGDIVFTERDGRRTCAVRDRADGELLLEFSGPMLRATPRPQDAGNLRTMEMHTYPVLNGRKNLATIRMNLIESAEALFPRGVTLKTGHAGRAELFRELRLGSPLIYQYAPAAESILFMPQPV